MERAGDFGGSKDGAGRFRGLGSSSRSIQFLRVELCHPPVVFARRVGGDVCEALGVGRPVELVHVQIGRGYLLGGFGRGHVHRGYGDALNLDAVLADDAGGRLHRRQSSGRTRGSFYI